MKQIIFDLVFSFKNELITQTELDKKIALIIKDIEKQIDISYMIGIFNTSGVDGLSKELIRLKGAGKNPHNVLELINKQ
jgi:hypothetical protein